MTADQQQNILIVDDLDINRALLMDMIGDDFEYLEAADGGQALEVLKNNAQHISIVLLDYFMPVMNGLEVLQAMKEEGWGDIPVIMISTESSTEFIEEAYRLGVTDFITRPFNTHIVRHRIMNALMLFDRQRVLVNMVIDQLAERERENDMMVSILSHIVESRNGESADHVLQVRNITELLLRQLMDKDPQYRRYKEHVNTIAIAASLHDVGKITIPFSIINKPGRFTDEEFTIMKSHSMAGAKMLEEVSENIGSHPLVTYAYQICRWHHERYDGGGYPDGLVGDDIPIPAQIVALADVYSALVSERVYKKAYPHEKAVEMIIAGECGTFNPLLIECFEEVANTLKLRLEGNYLEEHITEGIEEKISAVLNDGFGASNRTAELLDYERLKYQFFASMSNEVQFEYTVEPPRLELSDWGSDSLGLPETIFDPFNNEELLSIIDIKSLRMIQEKVHETNYVHPVISFDCEISVRGVLRWFHIDMRSMWKVDREPVFIGVIGKMVDIHQRQKNLMELQKKAYTDDLTGLLNRTEASYQVRELLEDAEEGKEVVMAIFDLDKFKPANDTYGHLFGDHVLVEVAKRLQSSVRGDDIVARIGGDEFLLCMSSSNPHALIRRIHDALEGDYQGFDIKASAGCAIVNQGENTSYEDLFSKADAALYYIKRAGGGAVGFADEIDAVGSCPAPESVVSDIESDKVPIE